MTTTALPARQAPAPLRQLMQFVRTPKGSVLIALTALAILAGAGSGRRDELVLAVATALGAALCDLALGRIVRHAWQFPSGGLVTGLIIGLILDPQQAPYVPLCAVVVAIATKYLFRAKRGHIFNPATLGLLVVSFLFGSAQSWWGALPDLIVPALVALFVAGYVIGGRVNKLPMTLVFAGAYVALFTAVALLGNPGRVAEMFRAPYVNAMLFFAFFMLTDPPTSPSRYRDQVWYGLIVAVVSIAAYLLFGGLAYLLVGLCVGNVWEAWRRTRASRRRPAAMAQPPLPGSFP